MITTEADLDALPVGSVVVAAVPGPLAVLVAARSEYKADPWCVNWSPLGFTSARLLRDSREWTVLRQGREGP